MNENQRAFVEETIRNATTMVQNDTEQRKKFKKHSTTERTEDKGQESKRVINLTQAKKVERTLGNESLLFRQLLEFEKRLNLSFKRRQASIQETMTKMEEPNSLVSRYFRVHVFNLSFEQQTKEVTAVPCWSLRIQGFMTPRNESGEEKGDKQITAEAQKPEQQQQAQTQSEEKWRFTQVFEKIAVELDKVVYPENYLFEWSPEEDPIADGIEITVPGNKECLAKIWLYPKNHGDVYKLSPYLASLLGTTHASFSNAAYGVWNYIKVHKLQSAEDKSCIQLDDVLSNLFNQVRDIAQVAVNPGEQIKLSQLIAVVRRHFQPNEPILVEYPVKLNGNWLDNQVCFDMRCDFNDAKLNDWVSDDLRNVLKWKPWEENKLFKAYEERYYDALERMLHHKRRRDFFQGFANNPVQFVNHLIISQSRDLKIISGMTGRNPDEEKLSSFYQQQWVREAVPRYLFRKVIQDAANRQRDHSYQGYESLHPEQRQDHNNTVSDWNDSRQNSNSLVKPKMEGVHVSVSEGQSFQTGAKNDTPNMLLSNTPSASSRTDLFYIQ
ncbi:SWI/SNF complex component SNF12 [Galdieria sulphuraria]|uniref:SWI/SNF-related matrix-associated actin-dependent regulator ofchromatin subfamily D n=1 Tax=Galdieria sulphuraria TaxID=130081 RepID=M2XC61_GALSU|nr:SWI/SNF-related matrix-associated actin-dependent regulator ofchromatin subfamily D [Galdieria sulphuraria]EME27497.1 SWI/SNF-related matrix-associated actin-dependent regulator ofchromatin subfamily D [Galdieria sulphuraria]GJD06448.1 SWI/SNF complex component SNF12 [Galdieria sulphuraria]|eukprot:XP_005704017.1 SWI/SNF-related matrix-associated actin-dependent regulator ofchromatin subfamily D [Galdieria sulphuraria]